MTKRVPSATTIGPSGNKPLYTCFNCELKLLGLAPEKMSLNLPSSKQPEIHGERSRMSIAKIAPAENTLTWKVKSVPAQLVSKTYLIHSLTAERSLTPRW